MASDSEDDNSIHQVDRVENSEYDEEDGFLVADDEPLEYVESGEEDIEEGQEDVFTPPPMTQRQPRRFPRISDSDDDVKLSPHFQEDEVESPKKKSPRKKQSAPDSMPSTPKRSNLRKDILVLTDSEDEDDQILKHSSPIRPMASSSPKKSSKPVDVDQPSTPRSPSKKTTSTVASPAKKTLTPLRQKAGIKSKAIISDTDSDEAATRLVASDTDYPNKGSKKVLGRNLKRPLVTTPPLATRSRSVSRPQEAPQPSPTKKVKTQDAVEERPLKSMGYPSKSGSASAKGSTQTAVKPKSGQNQNPSIFSSRAPANENQTIRSTIWNARPYTKAECEVRDAELFDKTLEDIGAYKALPKLRFCDMVNIGNVYTGEPTGTIMWSVWAEFLPQANLKVIKDLLLFVRSGRYINLSRVNPLSISARAMASNRHELTVSDGTAICISLGLVRNSFLVEEMGNHYPTHGIRMVLHTYEYQRFVAVLGEIPRRDHLSTQIWDFAVVFATKTRPTVTYTEVEKKTKAAMSRFYKVYESPKKSSQTVSGSNTLKDHIGALDFNDDIPVYDAREIASDFKWTSAVFDALPSYFELYRGQELPPNSLAAVGYITQYYTAPSKEKSAPSGGSGYVAPEENLRVGCMIKWIIYFGSPALD